MQLCNPKSEALLCSCESVALVTPMSERDINIAAWLFVVMGVGYLFPFSALTQPIDYWHKLFPDFNVEFPLTFVYMWVNLVALTLIVFSGVEPNYTLRLVGGFIGQFAVLIFVPSIYFFHLDERMNFFFLMVATSFVAIITAYIDSVIISFASQYPKKIIESMQFGIGLSSLIGSVYRLFTKAVFLPSEVIESSMLYFYVGAFTVLSGVASYYIVLSLPLSKERLYFGVGGPTSSGRRSRTTSAMSAKDIEYQSVDVKERTVELMTMNGEKKALVASEASYGSTNLQPTDQATEVVEEPIDKWQLFRRVFYNEFQVFLVYFTTLTVWPPLVTDIRSFNFPSLNDSQWWPLLLMFVLAMADCLGRLSVPYRMGLTANTLPYWVYLRIILIPLMICSAKSILFTNDLISIIFVFTMGFSNGYLGSLAIIFCTEAVDEGDRGIVGMWTGFFLNCGLVLGATASLLLEFLMKI